MLQQSKGNHIWTIEAKKQPDKRWLFRPFERAIKGVYATTTEVGAVWTWSPRVWDPQASITAASTKFSSPSLPNWLDWDNNHLSGEVPESARGTTIKIVAHAEVTIAGIPYELEKVCRFKVKGRSGSSLFFLPWLSVFHPCIR